MGKTKEKRASWWTRYYKENREKVLTQKKQDPLRHRFNKLNREAKRKGYAGINVNLEALSLWYHASFFVCDGRCPCCTNFFGKNEPQIDHDHKTGELRNLLCKKCNWLEGLGLEHLQKATAFISAREVV